MLFLLKILLILVLIEFVSNHCNSYSLLVLEILIVFVRFVLGNEAFIPRDARSASAVLLSSALSVCP